MKTATLSIFVFMLLCTSVFAETPTSSIKKDTESKVGEVYLLPMVDILLNYNEYQPKKDSSGFITVRKKPIGYFSFPMYSNREDFGTKDVMTRGIIILVITFE